MDTPKTETTSAGFALGQGLPCTGRAPVKYQTQTFPHADITKPWAPIVRVEGEALYGNREPTIGVGDAFVRLPNYESMPNPAAFERCGTVCLTIRYTCDNGTETLAGLMLQPEHSIALGKALIEAGQMVKARRG